MGILDDIKATGASYQLSEEALYAESFYEIKSDQRRAGIWAMALAEFDMDQKKADARYITLRVKSLKEEAMRLIAELRISEESARQTQLQQQKLEEIEEERERLALLERERKSRPVENPIFELNDQDKLLLDKVLLAEKRRGAK